MAYLVMGATLDAAQSRDLRLLCNVAGSQLDLNESANLGAGGRGDVIAIARNQKRTLSLRLTVIARHMRQAFDRSVEQSGLTRAKWTLIAAVALKPGTTQRVLAELLEVREITVGRLIDRLSNEGFLTRRSHPTDGRAYSVYLAPAARPVLDMLDELAKIHEDAIFANFSEEDLNTLGSLLDSIASNLTMEGKRRPSSQRTTDMPEIGQIARATRLRNR